MIRLLLQLVKSLHIRCLHEISSHCSQHFIHRYLRFTGNDFVAPFVTWFNCFTRLRPARDGLTSRNKSLWQIFSWCHLPVRLVGRCCYFACMWMSALLGKLRASNCTCTISQSVTTDCRYRLHIIIMFLSKLFSCASCLLLHFVLRLYAEAYPHVIIVQGFHD